MNKDSVPNLESRLQRINTLLAGRKEEYALFGATTMDLDVDSELRKEADEIKVRLSLLTKIF